jgi:ribosomal protein L37E
MHRLSQFAGNLSCLHCDAIISTDVWPLNGDAIPFYFEEAPGAHSVEIKCNNCGKTSFVVWDEYPGPIEKVETKEAKMCRSCGTTPDPQFYLAVKVTVQQAISQGVVDFNDLIRQAEKGLSGHCDMKELRPLLRKAWIELHRGK